MYAPLVSPSVVKIVTGLKMILEMIWLGPLYHLSKDLIPP
ncbi:hypothetical protein EMIT0P265_50037 [Pseudomonas zeae]